MKKINVLLPTYNGSCFLREQLDSLVNQTVANIKVYIRDDGSNDDTCSIIDEYCSKKFKNIEFYHVKDKKKLGYPDCFWELLKDCPDADYYSFCDQDDWWDSTKIEKAINKLDEVGVDTPAMCYCKFDYYDINMNYIRSGENFKKGNMNFEQGLYYTFAPGFTQVINKSLYDKLDVAFNLGKDLPHDLWCQWIALAFGKTILSNEVLAKYRRHENAVTAGNKNVFLSIKRWWLEEINGSGMSVYKNYLAYFLDLYKIELEEDVIKRIEFFISKNNIRKCFYPHRLRPTIGGELALRIIFILGKC